MPLESRDWGPDPFNDNIASSLADLIRAVWGGIIHPRSGHKSNTGKWIGNYYIGGEILKADSTFHGNALTRGVFLKKDMPGGGGSATLRGGHRIIGLFGPAKQIVPGHEFFWKHDETIYKLHSGFLASALRKV